MTKSSYKNGIPFKTALIVKKKCFKLTGYGDQIIGSKMEYPSYDKWELGLQEFGGSDELVHEVFEEASDLRNIFALNLEKQHRTEDILKIHEITRTDLIKLDNLTHRFMKKMDRNMLNLQLQFLKEYLEILQGSFQKNYINFQKYYD